MGRVSPCAGIRPLLAVPAFNRAGLGASELIFAEKIVFDSNKQLDNVWRSY